MKTRPIPGAAEGLPANPDQISARAALDGLETLVNDTSQFARLADHLVSSTLEIRANHRPLIQEHEADMLIFLCSKAADQALALEAAFDEMRGLVISQEQGR